MSVEFIKYAFVAGELSNHLYGRGDLEKFDLGLALAYNWFVDYRGGASTRPGQIFVGFVQNDDQDTRFFEFRFSAEEANIYLILFGEGYIRFIQDGAYVLEGTKALSGISKASPAVVTTSAPHAFTTGDWVKIHSVAGMSEINHRTYQVGVTTATTFTLLDPFGAPVDTTGYGTYTSGGAVQRIYTIDNPYTVADFPEIQASQIRDVIRFTHSDYPIYNLRRTSHASWTMVEEEIGNSVDAPTGVTITPNSVGSAYLTYAVTAVINGEESTIADFVIEDAANDFTIDSGGYATISWTAVPGAEYYNVYRAPVVRTAAGATKAVELGYIGRAFGPSFNDNNIAPDFTKSPPFWRNPFATGAITSIEITAPGTGYDEADTVTITDPTGSGFVGALVLDKHSTAGGSTVVGVRIINPGSGYTSPTVVFSGGTGATAVATTSADSGTYPSTSAVFQQRQIYAGSDNDPMTLWGSRPKQLSNFDDSAIVVDSDAYEFELDTSEVTKIRHLLPTRGGLLIMSQAGVWLLSAGQSAVTPTNALAEPHSFTGVSGLPPLKIDTDFLYQEGKGSTVRLLSYNDFSKVYGGQDMSILSNHFFTHGKSVQNWTFASDPHKVVWAVRSDGAMLGFTLVKEQNVYAWTQHWTKGLYKDVKAIQEGTTDVVYLMVQRYINGRWTKFIEKQAPRQVAHVEDAFCVDAGLTLDATYPAATLNVDTCTGTGVTATASAAVFSAGDVGKVLRAGGGKAEVATFVSTTEITIDWIRDATNCIPEDDSGRLVPSLSGEWTLDAPVTVIGNLWHLEGETVRIIADGNVKPDQVVTNGQITLTNSATRVAVGLGYTCRLQTLPLISPQAVIEGKRKRVVGLVMRVVNSRGLKAGSSLSMLYEVKERTNEAYGEPTELQNGIQELLIEPVWDSEGQVFVVQEYPLPATLAGYVLQSEIGDDSD